MTKHLFFTCPIKALYMMKEFGVKFQWRQRVKAADDIFHDWGKTTLQIADTIDDFIGEEARYDNPIYIAPESEHIFEPKDQDQGARHDQLRNWYSYARFEGGQWVYHGAQGEDFKIIMRDNKQFFAAEVEND